MCDSTRLRTADFATPVTASRTLARAAALLASLIASLAHAGTTWIVNNTGEPQFAAAANCAPANPNTCTLRDAFAAAASDDTIHFALADNATIGLGSSLSPPVDMTIDGTGVANLTIDGQYAFRPFVLSGVTVTLAWEPNCRSELLGSIPRSF